MRAFSGIVDLPALFMVCGALFIIVFANGFALKRSAAMARAMLLEVALLLLLISLVPLFEDPLNFMTLPYVVSFGLVIFALSGFATITLGVLAPAAPSWTADNLPKFGFRIASVTMLLAATGYLAIGNTTLSGYFQIPALIFVMVMVSWVGGLAYFSRREPVLDQVGKALPGIAIIGMIVGISAAVLDVYEIQFLLPLLGFGINVGFLAVLLHVLLQLAGWINAGMDSLCLLSLVALLSAALGLVLVAQELA